MSDLSPAKPANAEEPAESAQAKPRRGDAVTRILATAVVLAIIVLVASSATLIVYTLQLKKAPPRTDVERRIAEASAAVSENPKKVENYAKLAHAQAEAGRFGDAEATISRGRKVADAAILALTYGDIAFFRKEYGEGLRRYASAESKANAEFDQKRKDYKAQGIKMMPPKDAIVSAALGQARCLVALQRSKEAKARFDYALKLSPLMADVLAERGDLEAKAGDAKAAKADYSTALRLVPDLAAAQNGLKQLEKENR